MSLIKPAPVKTKQRPQDARNEQNHSLLSSRKKTVVFHGISFTLKIALRGRKSCLNWAGETGHPVWHTSRSLHNTTGIVPRYLMVLGCSCSPKHRRENVLSPDSSRVAFSLRVLNLNSLNFLRAGKILTFVLVSNCYFYERHYAWIRTSLRIR